MKAKAAKYVLCIIGAMFGVGIVALISLVPAVERLYAQSGLYWIAYVVYPAAFILFGFITLIFCDKIISGWMNLARGIDQRLGQMQMADLIFAAVGLLLGLTIAFMLSALLRSLPYPLYLSISLSLYIVIGSTCSRIAQKRWHELPFLTQFKKPDGASPPRILERSHERSERRALKQSAKGAEAAHDEDDRPQEDDSASPVKLLDSSVLIDGRIVDICKTGFLEGRLIVPQFILEELQRVADSGDTLKRRRGRRGLDVVAELQRMDSMKIEAGGYGDSAQDNEGEVDMRLLKLTRRLNGVIMTNDYNLNKVAELSGVSVLNINELANALKPALLPGEEMTVTVLKEGKEHNQGIAYLEDGTMIVVENGRELIGSTAPVVVTSVLQTAAGRMIFAKPKE